MIWLPTVWTGLNEDIGSWKMRAISAPRMDRISEPFGASFARSTTWPVSVSSGAGRRKRISPSTIQPGRSTIRRMDLAVTLLPQPLSPTIPSVAPGYKSKLTPSTAFTSPSSCGKYVFKFRTDSSGWPAPATGDSRMMSSLPAIGVGGIPQSIAQEVERHDDDDHRHGREHEPGRDGHRLDVLGLLQQDAPADRGRAQAEPQEAQRGLADDHRGQGQRGGRDDVARERGHHVDEDRAHLAAPDQPGRDHEIFFAHGEKPAADDPGQLGPAQHRDDDRDGEVDLEDRPLPRERRGQPHPQGNGRDRAQDLDRPLDQRVDDPAVEPREPAEDDPQDETHRDAE